MLIKKRKNTVPPWKIFILTVVGFGLMLAIAVHSRNEALNRLSQEYTIFRQAKAFCDEKMKREAGVFATGLQGKCTIFDTKEE